MATSISQFGVNGRPTHPEHGGSISASSTSITPDLASSQPRVRYQTVELGTLDIHLRTLRNLNEFSDAEGAADRLGIGSAAWPIFGVLWASGEVLAHHMLHYEIEGLRILEVGCGIGLTSLLLQHRKANITATDHHPDAATFLAENARLNELATIPFFREGWDDEPSALGRFDLIIGSDLLYEPGHAASLSAFIARHSAATCRVIIVDPGRREQSNFRKRMVALGYACRENGPASTDYLEKPFRGRILSFALEQAA